MAERIENARKYVALVDQLNNIIVVLDLSRGDLTCEDAVLWQWSPQPEQGFSFTRNVRHRLDEAKLCYSPAWGGEVLAVCSSSGFLGLAEYPSGRCLWNQAAVGYGPHSMEVLPDGSVAVACSGNGARERGCIRVYSAREGRESDVYAEFPLPGAHGVLWDPERELLWCLGSERLTACRWIGGIGLSEFPGLGGVLPARGGHDLSPVYGNSDRLWVSSRTVWQFSKTQNAFLSDYFGVEEIARPSVKSVGSFADGTVVQAVASNVYAPHDTDLLTILKPKNGGLERCVIRFLGRSFYKARIFLSARL